MHIPQLKYCNHLITKQRMNYDNRDVFKSWYLETIFILFKLKYYLSLKAFVAKAISKASSAKCDTSAKSM